MVIQEDIEQYGNFLQGDFNFVKPFFIGFQNTSMPIQSLPEVEIVTSNSTKCGGNFSVDEDLLLISAWLNISMDAMHGTEQKGENFWEKIWQYFCENNTYGTTCSVSSYQVDGEILIERQVSLLGSWLKLKPKIEVVRLTRTRYKLYCNGVTILISFIVSRH